jgi:hypothetical protein
MNYWSQHCELKLTFGTVASMIAWVDNSIFFSSTGGFDSALVRLGGTFFVGGLLSFTGLAVWYGLERSGFFVGVASRINSVIKLAARVCLDVAWGGDGEGESVWPHVCRSGEGTAGAVGFSIRGVAGGPLVITESPLACPLPLVCPLGNLDGPAVGWDGGSSGFTTGTRWGEDVSASEPTLLRFVSVFGGSTGVIFIFEGADLEVPKAGEWKRLRGRALPAPCHLKFPLGFFDSDLAVASCGRVDVLLGSENIGLIGELLRDGLLEKRNGSGSSACEFETIPREMRNFTDHLYRQGCLEVMTPIQQFQQGSTACCHFQKGSSLQRQHF